MAFQGHYLPGVITSSNKTDFVNPADTILKDVTLTTVVQNKCINAQKSFTFTDLIPLM